MYFVFGLPRSRTAWLSVFLSQSGIYCHHEAVNGCYTEQEYRDKIEGCGDSTTGFIHCPPEEYEGKPTLIIEKSKSEFSRCIAWSDRTFNADSRKDLINQYDELMGITGMRVLQSEIDQKLPDIFEYLTGAEWSDTYSVISKFNIQANPMDIDYQAMEAYLNGQL